MPERAGPLPDPRHHLDDPDRKRRYTRRLFDLVAPRYDTFTRWFSFGMDAGWKRRLARAVAARLPPRPVVLDVACGTGDLARLVRRAAARTGARVIGVDAAFAMLDRARRRLAVRGSADSPAPLVCADMTAIPLADASVDAVTIGYGLRNAPDLDATLREVARVLRPGGVLATLDFYLPARPFWRRLFLSYLRHAGRSVGRWWHGDPHAYGYIEASLRAWMTAGELSQHLAARGLTVETQAGALAGGIGMHVVRR